MARIIKKEAVAYCRVSSQGQQNSGTGLDRQEQTVRDFAKQKYNIVKVYKEAFTGTEAERPVFETMIADLLDNGCRVIIVECLDRLARDLSVQLQIISLLASKKMSLINAMTGQDVTHPKDGMAKAMIQIQGTFAELDKYLLVRKLKKGRQAKREKNGHCEGRKPYGHYPGELEIVKKIKKLYRKPYGEKRVGSQTNTKQVGFQTIAKQLNKEKVPTRSGAKWSGVLIKSILTRKS